MPASRSPGLFLSLGLTAVASALGGAVAAQTATGDPTGNPRPTDRAQSSGPGQGFATTEVFPRAYAKQWGALANSFPFQTARMRYQQVFRSAEASGPGVFTALGMRADERYTATAGRWEGSVSLGGTVLDENTLGKNFALNYDRSRPPVVVYNGFVDLPAVPLNTSLTTFDIRIPFANPYLLVPAPTVNLLVEVVTRSTTVRGYYDKVHTDPTATTTRIWAASDTATVATGQLLHEGLVMALLDGCFAAYSFYGSGCKGSNGLPPVLSRTGLPKTGTSLSVDLADARANSTAILFSGLSDSIWNSVPLPLDLGLLGGPGCQMLAAPTLGIGLATSATGTGSVNFTIPNTPTLCGAQLFQQFLVIDPNANGLGGVVSNGGHLVVGN